MPLPTSSLVKFVIFLAVLLFAIYSFAHAQTVDELKIKISSSNDAIQKLEVEIKQYQDQIDAVSKEKDSLSNNIKTLDLSKKKLQADTQVTENKIAAKNLEIKELSMQIGDKSDRITDSKRVIAQSLYSISQMNSASTIEALLNKSSFSDIWSETEKLNTMQSNMQSQIKDLAQLKTTLETNKKQTEQKKIELVSLTNDLKNQTKIIADNMAEKNSLLLETKNTEAGYRQLVATKKAQKDAFEKDLLDFESSLKTIINPTSLPATNPGVLQWPLDKVRITQYFGNTEFATKNPQAYNGKGHNGLDFGASAGTPVKAALSGVVVGSGNMDLAGGGKCRSYGKWILLKHNNGLSTLYAHLSLIKVTQGQMVSTGDIIALSGYSGYVLPEGPRGAHLHFSVYATSGVTITTLTNSNNCNNTPLPVAPKSAYLNPLSYLPSL